MNYYYVSYESIRLPAENQKSIFGKMIIKGSSYAEAQDKFLDWIRNQDFYPNMQRLFFSVEEVTDPIID